MGNYQEYLKMVAPLREVDPGQSRLHAFGNPFKLKQDHQVRCLMVENVSFQDSELQNPSLLKDLHFYFLLIIKTFLNVHLFRDFMISVIHRYSNYCFLESLFCVVEEIDSLDV